MCSFNWKRYVCPCENRKNCAMINSKTTSAGKSLHVIDKYAYVGWGTACDKEMERLGRGPEDSPVNLGRQSCPETKRESDMEKNEPLVDSSKCSMCALWCNDHTAEA